MASTATAASLADTAPASLPPESSHKKSSKKKSDFSFIAPAVASATTVAITAPLHEGPSSADIMHQRSADLPAAAAVTPGPVPAHVKANKLPHSLNVSNSGHSISTTDSESGISSLPVSPPSQHDVGRKTSTESQPHASPASSVDPVPQKTPAPSNASGTSGRKKTGRYQTLTKTRKFIVDGKEVVKTTTRTIQEGERVLREDFDLRKADLRELKRLQKLEQKQRQELALKSLTAREAQEKRFDTEKANLIKYYDTELDQLYRQQKQQIEKAESSQETDMRMTAKKIKVDQDRELRHFKEQQKQELKLVRVEVEMLPRDQRKEATRKLKEQKERDHMEQERQFIDQQQDTMERLLKRLNEQHREKIALLEKQFLQQKQQLLRAREAAIWEMEERQLHEKYQVAKSQLKDHFFLQRHQMLTRHDKELEQVRMLNSTQEEELLKSQLDDKKKLPRILKKEMNVRSVMFKRSMRITQPDILPEQEREKIKQFDESEKKRYKAELQKQEKKFEKQLDSLRIRHESTLKELEQLQNEKRKMLMEHETLKLRELEAQYSDEIKEWKAQLRPRKQKLEEELLRQREEQEKFYVGAIKTDNDEAYHDYYGQEGDGSSLVVPQGSLGSDRGSLSSGKGSRPGSLHGSRPGTPRGSPNERRKSGNSVPSSPSSAARRNPQSQPPSQVPFSNSFPGQRPDSLAESVSSSGGDSRSSGYDQHSRYQAELASMTKRKSSPNCDPQFRRNHPSPHDVDMSGDHQWNMQGGGHNHHRQLVNQKPGLRNSYAGMPSAYSRSPDTKTSFRRSVIMEDSESYQEGQYGPPSNQVGSGNRNSFAGDRLTHSVSSTAIYVPPPPTQQVPEPRRNSKGTANSRPPPGPTSSSKRQSLPPNVEIPPIDYDCHSPDKPYHRYPPQTQDFMPPREPAPDYETDRNYRNHQMPHHQHPPHQPLRKPADDGYPSSSNLHHQMLVSRSQERGNRHQPME